MSINISDQITLAQPLPLDSKSANILLSGNNLTIELISQFLLRLGTDRELGKQYIIYDAEPGSFVFDINMWADKINFGLVWAQIYKFEGGIKDEDFVPYIPGDQLVVVDNLESHSTIDALSANQGRVLKEMIENQVILYTNEEPTTAAVGGIPSGSTFENKTMQEMFDMLLYPYQYPAFTSFSISGVPTTLEVCQSISPTKTYLWSTSNPNNINANTIEIWHGEFSNSGLSNDGSEVITDIIDISEFQIQEVPTVLNIPGTYNFQIQAQNSQNDSFSRIFTVTWKYKIFHGTSITDPTDSAAIRALANSLFDTNSLNITIDALKYVIAVPEGKTITMVRTSNFEDITDNFIKQPNVIEVLLPDNVTTKNYDIYILTTALPLDVTATVTLV